MLEMEEGNKHPTDHLLQPWNWWKEAKEGLHIPTLVELSTEGCRGLCSH